MLNCILMFATNIENSKKSKILYIFLKKPCVFLLFTVSGHEYKKIFKEEESIELLKILGLINNIKEYQKKYNHA